jgi:hypothetical protein
MLIAAFVSVISAPWIGFFDIHFNFPLHMVATLTFTAGEMVYLVTLCVVVIKNRAEFPKDVQQSNINFIIYLAVANLIVGIFMLIGFFAWGLAL